MVDPFECQKQLVGMAVGLAAGLSAIVREHGLDLDAERLVERKYPVVEQIKRGDGQEPTLGSDRWDIEEVEPTQVDESEAFWSWRTRMDLWRYACDEAVRRGIDEAHPRAAEGLREAAASIDCSEGPPEED